MLRLFLCGVCVIGLTSCRSVGPRTVPRDRFDYASSITESWKRQTLLNIVKVRYIDPPAFVDIGNIVAGYSLETGANVGGQLSSSGAIQGDSLVLGGAVRFIDRPTITYVPLTGNRFVKSLMTPIPPESLFWAIQSAWRADTIFQLGVSRVNGLRNEEISLGGYTAPDPEFLRVTQLLRQIQLDGAVGMRLIQNTNQPGMRIVTLRTQGVAEETVNRITELRRLLGLDPQATEFNLVYGGVASNSTEISVTTRSLFHINQSLAMRTEVPEEDIQEGRTVPGIVQNEDTLEGSPSPLIRCGASKPEDAFVAVNYRDHWFWIDDRDLRAKRALNLMMLLFTLADTGDREGQPIVTIPAL